MLSRGLTTIAWMALLLLVLPAGPEGRAHSQEVTDPCDPPCAAADPVSSFLRIGTEAGDRERLDQIRGLRAPGSFLVRSPGDRMATVAPDQGETSFALLAPELRTVWNSSLPFSFNDGALWAGRGLNVQATAGAVIWWGPVQLVLAPEAIYVENRAFQTIPYPETRLPRRSEFATPWYSGTESLDLPLRPGSETIMRLTLGQSSVSLTLGPASLGISTENLWWGPGIRNAIVMSDHASGIPHAFLRMARPLRTPIGTLYGRWIVGELSESKHFDFRAENDRRSISAAAVVLHPAAEPNLAVGFSRAVYGRLDPGRPLSSAALDVFRNMGRPNSAAPAERADFRADQISALFARWIFPRSGFEAYAEWARFEQPISVRDFLLHPHHSQGYTLGAQWARPDTESFPRLRVEITYLEPSATIEQRPLPSTYASRVVEQGYTQRGQVIGASIGPGASSQWIALDQVTPDWRLGLFAGRIRWDEGVHATAPAIPDASNHDVSLFGGIDASVRLAGFEVSATLSHGIRYNYLFQNRVISLESPEGVDVRFTSLGFQVEPAPRDRR